MVQRRARPTVRVLSEDLTAGWLSPDPLRRIERSDWRGLHPLAELPHPIITKAAESFGTDPSQDNFEGLIHGSKNFRLAEIKSGQWRGGVWCDPDGTNWLVVAGLAKGGHDDHDDFYKKVAAAEASGALCSWLPTDEDRLLVKRETAAGLLLEWELAIQKSMLDALRIAVDGDAATGIIPLPNSDPVNSIAAYELSIAPYRESDYNADELVLSIVPEAQFVSSNILWQATIRALVSIHPPESDWDRDHNDFFTITEPGTNDRRIEILERLVRTRELADSQPVTQSHYTHRRHLTESTIDGKAVRGLCGVFFVPRQDFAELPKCPECENRYTQFGEI